jgi:predicted transcriptional regulator
MNQRLIKYGLVSNNVVRDPEICLRSKGLYAYLCTYADSNNECTVSVNRIAAECNMSHSSVKRILDILVKKGVIVRQERAILQSYKTTLIR